MLQQPHRIRRLVLIGTGSGGPAYMRAPGGLWNRSHRGFAGAAALGLLLYAWPRRASETLLNTRRSYVDRRWATTNPVLWWDWVRPRTGHPEWHRVARRLNYRDRLGGITAPALVLCGHGDVQSAPACSEELAAGIPDARLVTFLASNHFAFLEEPQAFWDAVRAFLTPVAASDAPSARHATAAGPPRPSGSERRHDPATRSRPRQVAAGILRRAVELALRQRAMESERWRVVGRGDRVQGSGRDRTGFGGGPPRRSGGCGCPVMSWFRSRCCRPPVR
jgi:hypothetical protein